ncbi:MAG: VCBS repeat-containing protein [Verrucomicrobia bacterium]|nr:VCBS repeat-containing protein [Verrucomicrobiota bacterium]
MDWQSGEGFRWAELPIPKTGHSGFTLLPPERTGITFTNLIDRSRYTTNQIYLNGSGVAAGDVDGDGRCDLFFGGLGGRSVLYRNLGDWQFQDITASSGIDCSRLDVTGAAFADVDGDGTLDLLVNSVGGGTHIFLNDGKGHFTAGPVLNSGKAGMSLALAELEGDGALDLYIANYRTHTIRDEPGTQVKGNFVNGRMVVSSVNDRPATDLDQVGRFTVFPNGQIIENGEADAVYRNDGRGHFTPVSFTDGTFVDEDGQPLKEPPYDWGLSVMCRDLNGDGLPDIYVCNDFQSPDRIWINRGHGRFRALPWLAMRHTSLFSMGMDVGDLNRDGHDDLVVTDMLSRDHRQRFVQMPNVPPTFVRPGEIDDRPQYSRNMLFLNRGDGTFAETAYYSGVEASEWTWMPLLLDVDLDGYEDILIVTGHERDAMNIDVINQAQALKAQKTMSRLELLNLNNLFTRLELPKVAFRNRGNLTFEDRSVAWGFDTRGVSQGMAVADLDNDGDLDVLINNLNGVAGIYRNETIAPRVAVRLKGRSPNTRGIGAKLRLFGGAVPIQSQEMICGGRYLSADDAERVFAAGTLTNQMRLEVTWRDGNRSVVKGVQANRIYEVDETGATAVTNSPPAPAPPIFEDVSQLLAHTHHDEPFDDFARQGLLPRKLSQLGPGVAWYDVNGDGWDDLIVGSGRGGKLSVYLNNGQGGFTPAADPMFDRTVTRDQTAIVGWRSILFAGSANYEDGLTNGGLVRVYDLSRHLSGENILGQPFSCGPLAMADFDGSGNLGLFAGGRVMPGRYPEPVPSLLLRNDGHRLSIAQRWDKLGLVSGAVWSDLDGDGFPELILACEWGPIRIFHNDHGHLTEWNPPVRFPSAANAQPLTLHQLTGWWNGVTTGDLDGDGRLDIIVSNWGLNTAYRASRARPQRLYYGDLSDSGLIDLIEARYDEAMQKEVPERGFRAVSAVFPFLLEKFSTFASYAHASVQEIYGDRLQQAAVVQANTLESLAIFNRGDHFDAVPLPLEAQLAPAFAVCVGDMDGDGNEDVFLSQNFFDTDIDRERADSGRGLWLKGDGKGGLRPVPGQESGVEVYGEQRGAALCDYDGDGRVDLVVTQNRAATKLYHNVGARPGLRVRLRGPAGNPSGVGAVLRLRFGERWGAAREVHAGSGYWSQDSAVEVLGTPETPTQIQVRWPGGGTTTSNLPTAAHEIEIDPAGVLKLVR